jgi:hypothetical protein
MEGRITRVMARDLRTPVTEPVETRPERHAPVGGGIIRAEDVPGAIHLPLPASDARRMVDDFLSGRNPEPANAYFDALNAGVQSWGGQRMPVQTTNAGQTVLVRLTRGDAGRAPETAQPLNADDEDAVETSAREEGPGDSDDEESTAGDPLQLSDDEWSSDPMESDGEGEGPPGDWAIGWDEAGDDEGDVDEAGDDEDELVEGDVDEAVQHARPDAGSMRIRREEARVGAALVTQLGRNVISEVTEGLVGLVPIQAADFGAYVAPVAVFAAAREPCTITIAESTWRLEEGGVVLIPAGVPFECDPIDLPVVCVDLDTVMERQYDVIADREAETGRPWDEVDANQERRGRRWTPDEEELLLAMEDANEDWNDIAVRLGRSVGAAKARASRCRSRRGDGDLDE